jgi:hypothetical protein
MIRRLPLTVIALALALVPLAAAADHYHVDLTAAGQADARAVTLQRADLGHGAVWTGGAIKPDLAESFPACSYKPEQSDIVLIGAAESDYRATGLEFDSNVDVLQSPAMVALDWQRTVVAPQVLPCMREVLAGAAKPPERLVSFERISFPHIAQYARYYRAIVDVTTSTGGTVQVMIDTILLGRNSTEISLTTTAPYVDRTDVSAAELRLADILLSRVRAAAAPPPFTA